jgi:crotonobetainyl-CoA:carnitine CoA-transferase CaiB-like acyl-CoA transferase
VPSPACDAQKPLAGLRAPEVSSFAAVPLAGTLAQPGARVVCVERLSTSVKEIPAPHPVPRDPGTVAGEVSSDPRATAIGLASP